MAKPRPDSGFVASRDFAVSSRANIETNAVGSSAIREDDPFPNGVDVERVGVSLPCSMVVRLSDGDRNKRRDVRRLIEIVGKKPKCDLWSSIPCGPWSTWQYVNLSQYGPEFAAELNDALRGLHLSFSRSTGRIAYEWPRHCLGWTQPFMKRFLDDPEILTVNIDGCDFGMKDKNGTPIRKQWKIATNSPDLAAALGGRACHHEKGLRAPGLRDPSLRLRRSIRNRCVRQLSSPGTKGGLRSL